MADAVDRAAVNFASAWTTVKNKVNKIYQNILNRDVSNSVKVTLIADLDLTLLMLQDPVLFPPSFL